MLSITKKMQRIVIFFIVVKVLHVSGGFTAHPQEIKNWKYIIRYLSDLHAATARVVSWIYISATLAVSVTKPDKHQML
jgi:hypothetical protein